MAATTNTITEASKMLEAALQQMDGIISGTNNNLISSSPTPSSKKEHSPPMQIELHNSGITSENVLLTAKTLAMILQQIDLNTPPPDLITAGVICEWLERHQLIIHKKICDTNKINNNTSDDSNNGINNENVDRFKRFQYDKEAMIKEYQSMMDKVSMQSHKIIELEGLLTEKTQQMSLMEEQLQRHICTRSELETQKLELITALSELKLHRATIERENYAMKSIEQQQQYQHLEASASNNSNHLEDVNGNDSKISIPTSANTTINSNNNNDSNDIVDLRKIHCENSSLKPKTPPASVRHKLQTHFHSLPRSHCLKIPNPKIPWTAIMLGHTTNSNNNNNNNNTAYNQQSKDNDMNGNRQQSFIDEQSQQKQFRRTMQQLNNSNKNHNNNSATDLLMCHSYTEQQQQSSSKSSTIKDIPPKNSMNQSLSPLTTNLRERSKKSICHLLGKLRRSNSGQLDLINMNMTEENERLAEFRRGDRARLTAGGRIEWSTAENRNDVDDGINDQQNDDNGVIQKTKPWSEWSTQDIYKWLNSLNLNCYFDDCNKWLKYNPTLSFFTTPIDDILDVLNVKMLLHRKKIRLARDELMNMEGDSLTLKASKLDVNWVMRWLDDIGLPQYKDIFYLHRIDGRLLHRLTMDELLLELKINSSLHVASLRRGIQCMREMEWNPECLIRRSACGNHNQQQNRNSFDFLTMMAGGEQHLITSTPRSRNYNSLRQFDDGNNNNNNNDININRNEENDGENVTQSNHNKNDNDEAGLNYDDNTHEIEVASAGSETISLWTAHRVMEWLRAIDLSEYAPNLRGAGVHGSLMLYENRFNANLLADLLSIPSSKTLLRRHLATHFKELLGREVIQRKREAETVVGYQPLTITAKLKPPKTKRTQFSLKKRAKSITKNTNHEGDLIEYVCPMQDLSNESNELTTEYQQHNNSTTSSSSTNISTTLNNNTTISQ